jgi:hypothetical protein
LLRRLRENVFTKRNACILCEGSVSTTAPSLLLIFELPKQFTIDVRLQISRRLTSSQYELIIIPAMTTDAKHQWSAAKLPLPLFRSFDQSCHRQV